MTCNFDIQIDASQLLASAPNVLTALALLILAGLLAAWFAGSDGPKSGRMATA